VWVVCSVADTEQTARVTMCVYPYPYIHWCAHFPHGPMNFSTADTHICVHIARRLLLFVGNIFANICIFYAILLFNISILPHVSFMTSSFASYRSAFDSKTLKGRPRTSGKPHIYLENLYLQLVFRFVGEFVCYPATLQRRIPCHKGS